jgi:hypothetical protein
VFYCCCLAIVDMFKPLRLIEVSVRRFFLSKDRASSNSSFDRFECVFEEHKFAVNTTNGRRDSSHRQFDYDVSLTPSRELYGSRRKPFGFDLL